MFLDFFARYIFWLSYFAPSQHFNYNIELDLELDFDLDFGESKLMLTVMNLLGGFPTTDLAGRGFKDLGSDVFSVFHIEA